MIIKNNFNSKNVNPLDDYMKVGKGSHSLDNELEKERQGFIRENMNNPILRKLRGDDNEKPEDDDGNKWKFFQ